MQRLKLVVLAATFAAMISIATPAEAARRPRLKAPRKGLIARMIEAERRKNEWIRERIFRR